jgi:hypothetical protein
MESSEVLSTLILCGFMGALGQGVRAAVGLKSAATIAAQNPGQQTEFDAAYFTLSLMIGFTAGILAGLAIGLQKLATIDPNDPKMLLAIIAAGYAGTDFIENAFTNLVPRGVRPPQIRTRDEPKPVTPEAPPKNHLVREPVRPSTRTARVPSYAPKIDVADLTAALKTVAPLVNTNIWAPALSRAFLIFDLTTDRRIAAAIGQFLVEAGDSFSELVEDLYYDSAVRLAEVYPNDFPTIADAEPFVRNPEALANRVMPICWEMGTRHRAMAGGFAAGALSRLREGRLHRIWSDAPHDGRGSCRLL